MVGVSYRMLCGVVGALFALGGLGLFGAYLSFHMPGGTGFRIFPMGPGGHYMAAMAGVALLVWGGCLLSAARRPEALRAVGTATALGLALFGATRIHAWVMGDYANLGHLLRAEAAVFLLLALAFVWLRPRARVA